MPIKAYVTQAITDDRILPDTDIPDSLISDQLSIMGSPGEFVPATFTLKPSNNVTVEVEASDLIGTGGSIPAANIDIRTVKCWYQAGGRIWDISHKQLTPELLLKDDSLVKVEGGENYLKVSGNYIHISSPSGIPGISDHPTPSEFPVQDADTLQPVEIPGQTNKQFWITTKIPEGTPAGVYSGTITISAAGEAGVTLQLTLEVLPIELEESYLIYSLYYHGALYPSRPQGGISDTFKTEEQLRAELQDMFDHGVKNPTSDQEFSEPNITKYLTARNEIGMGGQPFYLHDDNAGPAGYWPIDRVQQYLELVRSYGFTDLYMYGVDEAYGQALLDQRESWQAIRNAGGKMFVACYFNAFELVGDLLDLAVYCYEPSAEEAAKWHSVGHQIFCYNNPQVGEEKPETYRRNFGLLLWQADYDGAMNFSYQWQRGNIWNDFDDNEYRDHVFAYPTINGVIDTIEWEGWREGVTDVRYLTTLLDTIEWGKMHGKDTTGAENYLANLKNSNLANLDLDTVRQDMINFILSIKGTEPLPQHILTISSTAGGTTNPPPGSYSRYEGSQVTITAIPNSGYQFTSWREGGVIIGTEQQIVILMDNDRNIIAEFEEGEAPPPPPPQLVCHLKLDEGAGAVAHDSSPFKNDGTIIGATWVAEGLSFDGVDDYISIPNSPSLDITGAITIVVRFKPESAQEVCSPDGPGLGNYGVMAKADLNKGWSWQLRYGAPGKCYLGLQINDIGGGDKWVTLGQNLTPGNLYHVACTFDGANMISYLNGQPIETNTASGITSSIADLLIGEDGWHNYFNGIIREVKIWNRALTAEEVEAEFEGVPPPIQHILTINTTVGGTTDPEPGSYTYDEGAEVLVSAIPSSGYQFVGWREGGVIISTDQQVSVLIDGDRTIEAVFEEVVVPPQQYALTVSVIGDGSTEPSPGTYTYEEGEMVTVEAIPYEGNVFSHWEGDVTSNNAVIEIEMTQNMSIVAVFAPVEEEGEGIPWPAIAIGSGLLATVGYLIYKKRRK